MSSDNYSTQSEYENALIQKAVQEATEKARKKAQEEWQKIEKNQRFLTLYKEVGLSSTKELIKVLQAVSKGKAPKGGSSGSRARITPEIIAKVKELKAAGKGPSEISRTVGISIPSVYNVLKKA